MEQLPALITVAIIFFYLYFQQSINQKKHESISFKKRINGDLYKYHTSAGDLPFIKNGVKLVKSVTSYRDGEIYDVCREFDINGKETLNIEYVIEVWNIVGVNPISCEDASNIRENPFELWSRKEMSELK